MVKVLDGMTIVNGPAFTADGSLMYVADTFAGLIYACEVEPRSGDLSARRVFARVPPSDGSPDGMTVDSAGRLWLALWDGAAVRCYRPDGAVEATIPVPVQRPTCVCLGGADGGTLFVSTARFGIRHPGSADGAILHTRTGASGSAAASFAPARLTLKI